MFKFELKSSSLYLQENNRRDSNYDPGVANKLQKPSRIILILESNYRSSANNITKMRYNMKFIKREFELCHLNIHWTIKHDHLPHDVFACIRLPDKIRGTCVYISSIRKHLRLKSWKKMSAALLLNWTSRSDIPMVLQQKWK